MGKTEEERMGGRRRHSIICDGHGEHRARGLAEGGCRVTASEGERGGCSAELGGNTFTLSLH